LKKKYKIRNKNNIYAGHIKPIYSKNKSSIYFFIWKNNSILLLF